MARFLVIGDTHIGYKNRSRSNQVRWQSEVDCVERFRESIGLGLKQDVDGVIHAGDIFDEQVSQSEMGSIEDQLYYLKEHSIPFYYVTGNHENSAGLELLEAYSEDVTHHLTTKRSMIGIPSVCLFGIDYHKEDEFQIDEFSFSLPVPKTKNILILHQTIMPLREQGEVDIRQLLRRVESSTGLVFDYIISGHLHRSERHNIDGTEILYTGSTARISKTGKDNRPSAWFLNVTENDVFVERQSLSA